MKSTGRIHGSGANPSRPWAAKGREHDSAWGGPAVGQAHMSDLCEYGIQLGDRLVAGLKFLHIVRCGFGDRNQASAGEIQQDEQCHIHLAGGIQKNLSFMIGELAELNKATLKPTEIPSISEIKKQVKVFTKQCVIPIGTLLYHYNYLNENLENYCLFLYCCMLLQAVLNTFVCHQTKTKRVSLLFATN